MNGFGQRLRELRGERTQAEAAQAIGLKASAYSMYEGERREPGFDTLVMIADHYGVSTDYLLGRTECKSPDIDTQAICEKTGLTEMSVKILMAHRENKALPHDETCVFPLWMNHSALLYINCLICDEEFTYLGSKCCHAGFWKKQISLRDECGYTSKLLAAYIDRPEYAYWMTGPGDQLAISRYRYENIMRRVSDNIMNAFEISNVVDELKKAEEENGETQSS